MTDFAKIAGPLLEQLRDDPSRPPPQITDTTTFPLGGGDLEGQLIDLDRESDNPTLDGGSTPTHEDVEAGRKVYREVGLDVLAFYKSFRFMDRPPFRGKWGIFILDVGIASIAAEYAAMNPALPLAEVNGLARATLLAHERYHFWIDAWAFGQEILPITAQRTKRYEYYIVEKQHSVLTEYDFEESLANHYVFRNFRSLKMSDGSNAGHLLRTFFESCPEPYSTFSYGPKIRAQKEGELASAVFNGLNPLAARTALIFQDTSKAIGVTSLNIRPASPSHPFVNGQSCPVYEVRVIEYAARVQPFQGPTLKEFRQFIEQYLNGQKDRTDHDYYRIDNGAKIKFPNPHDKEIRGYELKGTLLKAGMTHREFVNERISTKYWQKNCQRNPPKPPLGP